MVGTAVAIVAGVRASQSWGWFVGDGFVGSLDEVFRFVSEQKKAMKFPLDNHVSIIANKDLLISVGKFRNIVLYDPQTLGK